MPHSRPFAMLLVAGWYAVIATDAPGLLLDRLARAAIPHASDGFACARHACGCRTEADCRSRCCCAARLVGSPGHETLDQGTPRSAPGRYLIDSRCAGHSPGEALAGSVKAGPHLFPAAAAPLDSFVWENRSLAIRLAPASADPSPPGKVPR